VVLWLWCCGCGVVVVVAVVLVGVIVAVIVIGCGCGCGCVDFVLFLVMGIGGMKAVSNNSIPSGRRVHPIGTHKRPHKNKLIYNGTHNKSKQLCGTMRQVQQQNESQDSFMVGTIWGYTVPMESPPYTKRVLGLALRFAVANNSSINEHQEMKEMM